MLALRTLLRTLRLRLQLELMAATNLLDLALQAMYQEALDLERSLANRSSKTRMAC